MRIGDINGRRVAVGGLAFKPNTDDLCEAPSRTLLTDLFAAEATATACDPLVTAPAPCVSSDEVTDLREPSAGCA